MGTQKFRLGIPICEEFKSVAFVGKRWFWRKENCERSKNGPLKNDNFGVFLFFLQQTQSELDLLFFTGKRSHQRLLSQALSSYEAPQFPLNLGVYEVERPKYCRFDGPSSSTRRSPEVWLKFKNNNHQTPTIYGLISQRKYTRNIMEISWKYHSFTLKNRGLLHLFWKPVMRWEISFLLVSSHEQLLISGELWAYPLQIWQCSWGLMMFGVPHMQINTRTWALSLIESIGTIFWWIHGCYLPSGNWTVCYWKWPFSPLTYLLKWCFSVVYQRVSLESSIIMIFMDNYGCYWSLE